MSREISPDDILIRTTLRPGDIGYITYLHGYLYRKEYNYGIQFETYVAAGLNEFYKNYDQTRDRIWICEHSGEIVGSLLLIHRDSSTAQLRYFLIHPDYRGLGLGNKLMSLYMDFLQKCGYKSSFLWTTQELHAAASLYKRYGFKLTEEKQSTAFGKAVIEQRYDFNFKFLV